MKIVHICLSDAQYWVHVRVRRQNTFAARTHSRARHNRRRRRRRRAPSTPTRARAHAYRPAFFRTNERTSEGVSTRDSGGHDGRQGVARRRRGWCGQTDDDDDVEAWIDSRARDDDADNISSRDDSGCGGDVGDGGGGSDG